MMQLTGTSALQGGEDVRAVRYSDEILEPRAQNTPGNGACYVK